jgi:hypothetical protein
MTVVTRRRSDRFAIIPNAVAEDSRISFEARGVLCYLLAKPHNWQVQIADIQKAGGIGRDKVYRILNELKDAGYIKVTIKRDEQARIVSHDYVVYDDAVPDQLPFPEKTEVDEPLTENTEVAELLPEKPDTAEPDTANQDGLVRTDSKTKTHHGALAREGGKDFDILWSAWPEQCRPDNREAAARLFCKLDEADRKKVLSAAEPYRTAMLRRNKPVRMILFLRDGAWAEFHDAPEIDAKGYFIITTERPEWREWMGSIRREFGEPGVQSAIKSRRLLRKTRWPADLSLANNVTNLAPSVSRMGTASADRG